MFDVLHQLVDKVHGWRSEEDRVNAHAAIDDYRAGQEGTSVDPSDESSDTSDSTVTEDSTDKSSSSDLFTPSGDKSRK